MCSRVLYLHGFASGPGSKKAQYLCGRLGERGVNVEVPDLTGGDFEGLTITGQLEVVERLADGAPVSLIGSSLGGYIAALYAARHPEVRKMMLLAPAFGFARHFREALGTRELENWRATGWLAVYNYAQQRQSRIGYGLIEDGAKYEDYPDVILPTLVFHGRRDEVVPYRYSEAFGSGRPNVRVELLDSDHELLSGLVQIADAAAEFLG